MKCPECKTERGCGCQFVAVSNREYKVCPECKAKLEKNDKKDKTTPPNVQGV